MKNPLKNQFVLCFFVFYFVSILSFVGYIRFGKALHAIVVFLYRETYDSDAGSGPDRAAWAHETI